MGTRGTGWSAMLIRSITSRDSTTGVGAALSQARCSARPPTETISESEDSLGSRLVSASCEKGHGVHPHHQVHLAQCTLECRDQDDNLVRSKHCVLGAIKRKWPVLNLGLCFSNK